MAILTRAEREDALRELLDEIAPALGDVLRHGAVVRGELVLEVQAGAIVRVLTYLRDQPNCQFKMLIDICGSTIRSASSVSTSCIICSRSSTTSASGSKSRPTRPRRCPR